MTYELVPDVYFMVVKVPYHFKIFYWYFKFAMLINTVFLISDAYIFHIQKLRSFALLEHGLTPFYQAYANISIFIILQIKEQLLLTLKIVKSSQWPIENITYNARKTILRQAKEVRIAFYVMSLLVAMYLCLLYREVFKVLFIQYIFDHFPYNLVVFILLVFTINCVVLALCVMLLPFMAVYLSLEWIVQIELLNDLVQDVAKEGDDLLIYKNRHYQNRMTEVLKKIASRQIQIQWQYLQLREIIASASLKMIVGNTAFNLFMMFSFLKGALPMKVAFIYFLIFTLFYTYITAIGQHYEDKWRTYYKLICNLPWYTFNMSNRKTYLVILTGSTKTMRYDVWNSLALNYELYLQVWKTLYTIANTLYNLRGKYSTD